MGGKSSGPAEYQCRYAPPGSVLVFSGGGSGGRGSQWYYRMGAKDSPEEEHSLGFDRRWHAETWARDGMIKFHPRNKSGGQPSKTKGKQSPKQEESYAQ